VNILYIEPFYAGSHKQWIDSYCLYSKYHIEILSLPGRYWKWRMHGAAITLAKKFIDNNKKYDIIIASDMLNLPLFISLCRKQINNTKIVTYFHENQILYSKAPAGQKELLNRDLHYAFINYTSSLVSDINLFNSNYHLNLYLEELEKYLNKKPEYKNRYTLEIIKKKSSVLHIGCDLEKFSPVLNYANKIPILLWNHRWEHDKNPELFFNTLIKLKKNKVKYKLVILGQRFSRIPEIFTEIEEKLKSEIMHIGYCESFDDYKKWMHKADIIPITSYQDFFGISIVESVYCNTRPLLPDRLSYPEILLKEDNPELFYNDDSELYNKLFELIDDYKNLRNTTSSYAGIVNRFDWSIMKNKYDDLFNKIYNS
jgi:glycosyltransferase involved in cell wall biosynthesis